MRSHSVAQTQTLQVQTHARSGRHMINQYIFLHELGRGVYGQVRLALDSNTLSDGDDDDHGRLVGVKIVQRQPRKRLKIGGGGLGPSTNSAAAASARSRGALLLTTDAKVKREVDILKKLHHHDVVSLLEVIDDPDSITAPIQARPARLSARVVAGLKRVLEQIIKLGDSKNGDDQIQDFLYNTSRASFDADVGNLSKEGNEHLHAAFDNLRSIIETFAGGRSLDPLLESVRKIIDDVRQDERLTNYWNEIDSYVERLLFDEGFVTSSKAARKADDLYEKAQKLLESNAGWKRDAEALNEQLSSTATRSATTLRPPSSLTPYEEGENGDEEEGAQRGVPRAQVPRGSAANIVHGQERVPGERNQGLGEVNAGVDNQAQGENDGGAENVVPVEAVAAQEQIGIIDDPAAWWNRQQAIIRRLKTQPNSLRCLWMPACEYCGAVRLDYETSAFCCNFGTKMAPLPALTPLLQRLSALPVMATSSLHVNQVFQFAVQWYSGDRVRFGPGPPAVAVEGTVTRRVLPVDRDGSPLNTYLYFPQRMDAEEVEGVSMLWRRGIRRELAYFNTLLHQFRQFETDEAGTTLELRTEGPAREIATVLHYGAGARRTPRAFYVHRSVDDGPSRLSYNSELYEPLSYPILFPQGTPGWPLPGWTQREYYRFLLLSERRFRDFAMLGSLYTIDMMCRIEDQRLDFITKGLARARQNSRAPAPHEIDEHDPEHGGIDPASFDLHLQSSFVGSRSYRAEHVSDALALAKHYGKPHGMLTLTTNPECQAQE
ncbi:unnamed protein product [Tilletia caries]|nr:unnamed protein product [Tilletia caries]